MTKQALRELRDKVSAGEHWHFSQFEPPELPLTWIDAFNGSLDAAVDFLEAVLPGSDWVVRTCDPNAWMIAKPCVGIGRVRLIWSTGSHHPIGSRQHGL